MLGRSDESKEEQRYSSNSPEPSPLKEIIMKKYQIIYADPPLWRIK